MRGAAAVTPPADAAAGVVACLDAACAASTTMGCEAKSAGIVCAALRAEAACLPLAPPPDPPVFLKFLLPTKFAAVG